MFQSYTKPSALSGNSINVQVRLLSGFAAIFNASIWLFIWLG